MSLFELEVREKKNQAYQNRARSGTKGSSRSRKGMNTPYDYMSKSEREKLNGEVEVFNMHTVLTIEEFNLKSEETQKELLTKWREIYDNRHIQKELGISNKALYDLVAKLKVPRKTRVDTDGTKRMAKARQAKAEKKKTLLEVAEEQAKLPEKAQEVITPVLVSEGWTLSYNNNYTPEELVTIFAKAQLMVEGEKRKFKLNLTLTELR